MESLRDLGLSSYEDRAYRGLLGLGGTAADVTAESDVPKGRIYDALGGLESRGLVRVQSDREPKRYAPVEPAVSRRRSARRGQTPGAGAPDRDVRVGERRADRPVGRR